ncbi:MAG: DUF401 family protein [Promethearchaeota archaeon]
MSALSWTGFIASTVLLVFISRKSLWIALTVSALVLGFFTMEPANVAMQFLDAWTDPENLLLGISLAGIPVIGVLMERAGYMDALVTSIKIPKSAFNIIAPALVGLLPVPGGALISAPMINRAGSAMSPEKRCASNVWFRHVLFLIYPVSSTIILGTEAANLDRFVAILALSPFLIITVIAGYVAFLRGVKGKLGENQDGGAKSTRKEILRSFVILFTTPAIDISLRLVLEDVARNLSLVIGVGLSLFLALIWFRLPDPESILRRDGKTGKQVPSRDKNTRKRNEEILRFIKKAKPWNFFLFILLIFCYLNIFNESGIADLISSYNLPPIILLVLVGFFFGFITGRMNVPLLIIIPIYLTPLGPGALMAPKEFVTCFISIYVGYIMSPVHPCLSVTLEYFHVKYTKTVREMLLPGTITISFAVILSFFI